MPKPPYLSEMAKMLAERAASTRIARTGISAINRGFKNVEYIERVDRDAAPFLIRNYLVSLPATAYTFINLPRAMANPSFYEPVAPQPIQHRELFRTDTRDPKAIREAGGFIRKGEESVIATPYSIKMYEYYTAGHKYVNAISTSYSESFENQEGFGSYCYKIDSDGLSAYPRKHLRQPHPAQNEVIVSDDIPWHRIKAYKSMSDYRWTDNPDYRR